MADNRIRIILEAQIAQYQRGMQQARQSNRDLMTSVEQNRAALTKMGVAAVAAGGLIVKGLLDAGRESARFQSTITKLTTQVGIARDEAQALGAAALGLSSTGKGPQELGDALFFVTSAGLRGSEALDVLEASAKASSIGLGDTATVADLTTSAINAYGSDVLSASAATDVLIGAVREGKAEAPELAGALGRLLPIASEMGITFDQVGAATAAMTRTGTGAAEAATQLRGIMAGLLKPTQDTEAALSEFGLSAEGLRATIREQGLFAALMSVRDAVGDNEEALARIFPNIRAFAGVLDLTGAAADTNAGIFERMTDTTGLLAEGFAEWATTTEAAQSRFSAAMEAARISMGEHVEPAMRAMFDTGTGLALMFGDLDDSTKGAIAGVLGVSAGLLTTMGTVTLALVAFSHVRQSLEALNVTGAAFARFLTNPYVLAVVGATALLGSWAKAKADARMRVEELTDAIREDSGALGENTRARAEAMLAEADALVIGAMLGIAKNDLVDAVLNESDAYERLQTKLDGVLVPTNLVADADVRLLDIVTGLSGELATAAETVELVDAAQRDNEATALRLAILYGGDYTKALGDAESGTGDLGGAAGDTADEFGELATETDKARVALEEWRAAQLAITDPVLAVIDAVNGVRDAKRDSKRATEDLEAAQRDLTEVQGDAEASADDLERAQRRVEDAEEAVRRKSLDTFRALEKLRIEAADGSVSWHEFELQLDRWVSQGELTAAEAQIIRDEVAEARGEVDKFEGQRKAELVVEGFVKVRAQLSDTADLLHHLRQGANIPIRTSGASSARARIAAVTGGGLHTGGVIDSGGTIRRYHGGGSVSAPSLRHDEVPAILQTRERVLSRDQNEAFERLVRVLGTTTVTPGPSFHAGGVVGGASAGGVRDVTLNAYGEPTPRTMFRARDLLATELGA